MIEILFNRYSPGGNTSPCQAAGLLSICLYLSPQHSIANAIEAISDARTDSSIHRDEDSG